MSSPGEGAGLLFRSGKLSEAVAAAGAAVKRAPTDLGARVLLAELLLFSGDFERVDVLLNAATDLVPDAAVVIAEFRQLLRAELARRQLYRNGRVPEFLGDPTPALSDALAALVAWRSGDLALASQKVAAVETGRPRTSGETEGRQFADFRDLDDLSSGCFEILTTTGKYYWLPTERVSSIDFHPPRRPRDLFWRRASVSVTAGPDGDVYVPALYANDQLSTSEALKLGRETEWVQAADGLTLGAGQRVFLLGDDAVPVMELTSLKFGGSSE